MLVGFQFDFVSEIFAIEIVLPIAAVLKIIFGGRFKVNNHFVIIILFGLIFFVSLVLSDVWNQTSFEQYSRGWARLIVFMSNFASLYILIDNKRSRLLWFTLGMVAGRTWLSIESMEDGLLIWKLGLAKPVALATLLACVTIPKLRQPGSLLSCVLILALGLVNIVADYRSLGAVLVVVAALMLLADRERRVKHRRGKSLVAPIAAMITVGFLAAGASSWFYGYAASQGWLSERATNKYEQQSNVEGVPLIVAGRNEGLVSLEAIMDAPLLGHGSWPEDPYYAEKLAIQRYNLGLSGSVAPDEDQLIPTHSHLIGSWVEAGLAGGLFWAVVLALVGKSLLRSCRSQSHMQVLYLFCALLLVWDVLFSPFSGFGRIETAFLLVVVLRALLQRTSMSLMSRPVSRRRDRERRHRGRVARRRSRRSGKSLEIPV